jgi:hypothetical protein
VSLVAVDDFTDLLVVSPDDGAINLGIDAGGQRGGIDQVGEQDRQATDLPAVAGGGQQFFGVGVAAVDREHLSGQSVGCGPIASVDCLHCAVEQLIDRGLGHGRAHNPIVAGIVTNSPIGACLFTIAHSPTTMSFVTRAAAELAAFVRHTVPS